MKSRNMVSGWIGYNDRVVEGTFRWINASTDGSYTNWFVSEPNGGTGENCVEVIPAEKYWGRKKYWAGKWNDKPCSNEDPFICERPRTTKMRCRGENNGCCTRDTPCDTGEGDCDNDHECAGSLVCGSDNCPWGDADDCCHGLYSSIGCWRDFARRAIQPLEGKDVGLDGTYRSRTHAIQKCFQVAKKRGFRYFAVQHGGWCASSADAGRRYRMYGESTKCRQGKGGPWANDVYIINGANTTVYVVDAGINCWSRCGRKGGSCPGLCGSDGYCCRRGWGGCDGEMQEVAPHGYHTCVKYRTELRCAGQDGCCTKEKPCGRGEGDCDNYDECEGHLICGRDNCPWGANKNCCEELCPAYNVDYYGNDIRRYPGVFSWEKCGDYCKALSTCKFWTWNWRSTPPICYLKGSATGQKSDLNGISGWRMCATTGTITSCHAPLASIYIAIPGSPKYDCSFVVGEGIGGTEYKIGNQIGDACIEACKHRKKKDHNINGVTIFSDTSKGGCWCESKMTGVLRTSTKYKTCFLEDDIPMEYNFNKKEMSWTDAEQECEEWGGHLGTVTSQEQNDYFANELKERNMTSAWIGYNDRDRECLFEWTDSARGGGFINWFNISEPNGGARENCVELIPGKKYSQNDWEGKWNDKPCSYQVPFICQKPKEPRYRDIGCYMNKRRHAISDRMRKYSSNIVIERCYARAKAAGNEYFAVQNNYKCFTSPDAGRTYNTYGQGEGCRNGKGGDSMANVYQVLNRTGMTPGPDLGITNWGSWWGYVACPSLKKITGFRLQVAGELVTGDNTAVNGIEFSCQGDTTSEQIEYRWGTWTAWKTCDDDGHTTEFDLRAMPRVGGGRDDYGATNVRMKCSGGDEKTGDGVSRGDWVGYRGCQAKTFICGARAKIEGYQGINGDDTALNRIQMGCCPDNRVGAHWSNWKTWSSCSNICGEGKRSRFRTCDNTTLNERNNCFGEDKEESACTVLICPGRQTGPNLGVTSVGMWSKWSQCINEKKVTGFRLRVEEYENRSSFDNTAVNGIQLSCEDETTSEEIQGIWGELGGWTRCDPGAHITKLDLRATLPVGGHDYLGATNVRIKCSDGGIKEGDGVSMGQWVGYEGCSSSLYICGVRALIQKHGGDDTGVNRVQLLCCKGKDTERTKSGSLTVTIIVVVLVLIVFIVVIISIRVYKHWKRKHGAQRNRIDDNYGNYLITPDDDDNDDVAETYIDNETLDNGTSNVQQLKPSAGIHKFEACTVDTAGGKSAKYHKI